MVEFLKKSVSEARFATYAKLANRPGETRSPESLYGLNISYSKELYAILAALEIAVRNAFNDAVNKALGQKNWFDAGILQPKHLSQVEQAHVFLSHHKGTNYSPHDLVAHLNFGFWVHLCDRPYEKTLWVKALYKCFPYLGQKPFRSDIERRLKVAALLRNKIAHLEPIIKNEGTLIQEYRNISQLLYAISPETQKWFEPLCAFEDVWSHHNGGMST